MRDPEQIPEILRRLGEVWKKAPDLRLGQLIEDVVAIDHVTPDPLTLFFIEDSAFLKKLEVFNRFLDQKAELTQVVAEVGEPV